MLVERPLPELMSVLAERVRRARLGRNETQAQVAARAGVTARTLRSLERGDDVQLSTWLRILRALDLLDRLDVVLPETTVSPMALVKRRRAQPRQRASGTRDG